MGGLKAWDRGDEIAVRSRPGGSVGYTFPAIVLVDTVHLIALFQPEGTICKRRGGIRGGPRGRSLLTWNGLYEDVIVERSTVHVCVPGEPFWVIRSWVRDSFVGWYVNLAAAWRRTPIGFDSDDHILDIEVEDDLSGWAWKDEDELAWAVEQERCSSDEAAERRRHGLDAIARMRAGDLPFVPGAWAEWGPPSRWEIPALPAGWDLA